MVLLFFYVYKILQCRLKLAKQYYRQILNQSKAILQTQIHNQSKQSKLQTKRQPELNSFMRAPGQILGLLLEDNARPVKFLWINMAIGWYTTVAAVPLLHVKE